MSVNSYHTTQCHKSEGRTLRIFMLPSTIAISHMVEIKGNKQLMHQLLHNSKNPFCLFESDDERQRDNRVHGMNTLERGKWKGSSEWCSWWGMRCGVFSGRDVGSFFRCSRQNPRVFHPLRHSTVHIFVRERRSSWMQICWTSLSLCLSAICGIMLSNAHLEYQPNRRIKTIKDWNCGDDDKSET